MANEDQATFWTETAGPVWLANEAQIERSSRAFGAAGIEAAGVREGMSVVDLGCGTGTTIVDLAKCAGPAGRVLGCDISPLLLERARERVEDAGLTNVDFEVADAQTYDFGEASRDVVFSRFGVMFFDDSVAAFANVRRALRPDGRLVFVCWQSPQENPWMSLPAMAAMSVLGPLEQAPDPSGPGPFRFGDPDLIRQILKDADCTDVDVREFRTTMDVPVADADDRLGFIARMGPLGSKFAEADEATKRRVLDAIVDAAKPFETDGVFKIPAASWIVTAR